MDRCICGNQCSVEVQGDVEVQDEVEVQGDVGVEQLNSVMSKETGDARWFD